MSYYIILGIDRSANLKKIKEAYHKKAMKYHPDRNNGNKKAGIKFKEIAVAYSVLSDKKKRAKYDLMGDGSIDTELDEKAAFDIFNNFFSDRVFIKDINLDMSSKIYLDLIEKIKLFKKTGKILLIKITSHWCAGKTTFINLYKNDYLGLKLYDYDSYKGRNRKSFMLLEQKKNSVLFGGPENETYDEVIYLYVILKLQNLYKNIVHRHLEYHQNLFWANTRVIKNCRNELYKKIIKNNVIIKPLFYSFQDALDFCIKVYNEDIPMS